MIYSLNFLEVDQVLTSFWLRRHPLTFINWIRNYSSVNLKNLKPHNMEKAIIKNMQIEIQTRERGREVIQLLCFK